MPRYGYPPLFQAGVLPMSALLSSVTHVDESRLEKDLGYRFEYLAEFMQFGQEDVAVIQSLAPHLAPLVGGLVDAVYVQLFKYDATKRHFVPRQSGYQGPVPSSLQELP